MDERPIFAFVLMPFNPMFDDVYEIGIKEAASQAGIVANRLDEQLFVEGMMDRIYRQIEAADIIIADMSGQNPNVFYEVGYAHAKDKLCILLTKETKDIPFDLKHRRHIEYKDSIAFLRHELVKNLEWAKNEIINVRKSQIRVEVKIPSSELSTTSYSATAILGFKLDLFNDSNKPSSEINAIYFYAGNNWQVKQDDKECPKIGSDLPGFKHRYFLSPPVTRLQANSWAQLRFTATRLIAHRFSGDEILSSYRVNGRALFRFATSEGVLDYEHFINLKVEDIPF